MEIKTQQHGIWQVEGYFANTKVLEIIDSSQQNIANLHLTENDQLMILQDSNTLLDIVTNLKNKILCNEQPGMFHEQSTIIYDLSNWGNAKLFDVLSDPKIVEIMDLVPPIFNKEPDEIIYEIVSCLEKWYLIPVNIPNRADYIYTRKKDIGKSFGFGGDVLIFKLNDGRLFSLQGPWHTNSNSLFHDTGISVGDEYFTWGYIYEQKEPARVKGSLYTMINVIYQDNSWILDRFDRIENHTKKLVQHFKKSLYYSSFSRGGSSHCFIKY